jgi:hypothetical protein
MRIARAVSHLGIGADRQPWLCTKLLGHGTVPTFFWGGKAAKALTNVSASA